MPSGKTALYKPKTKASEDTDCDKLDLELPAFKTSIISITSITRAGFLSALQVPQGVALGYGGETRTPHSFI